MAMLSYKQYKLLQENLDGVGVIGISSPTNLGVVAEAPQLASMMNKYMDSDPTGTPPMGKPGMGKPPLGKPGVDDVDDMDDDDNMDDTEGDEDEEGGDEDAGDMGDEEGGMDMGGPGGPAGLGGMGPGGPMDKKKPPMMMKKMGAMYMKKEASDPQDAKMKKQNSKNKTNDQDDMGKGNCEKKTTFVRESCCSKCGNMMKKKSKKCCMMTKEEREFNDSLRRQTGLPAGKGVMKFQKDELGFWVPVTEDALIQPSPAFQTEEPQAGEPGFAPQGKVGGVIGSNFQEWAAYHKKMAQKNAK